MNLKEKSKIKINSLNKKIKDYQTKHPHRNWEQKHELSSLWTELLYWQLVAKGEIKPDPLFFKAEELWKNLKRSYQRKEEWPYQELKELLTKQPTRYTEYLIDLIQHENKEEYLNLLRWLQKMFKKFK